MQIRVGYELVYDCPQPTPMILTLHIHFTRVSDIIVPDHLITKPSIPLTAYRDASPFSSSRGEESSEGSLSVMSQSDGSSAFERGREEECWIARPDP